MATPTRSRRKGFPSTPTSTSTRQVDVEASVGSVKRSPLVNKPSKIRALWREDVKNAHRMEEEFQCMLDKLQENVKMEGAAMKKELPEEGSSHLLSPAVGQHNERPDTLRPCENKEVDDSDGNVVPAGKDPNRPPEDLANTSPAQGKDEDETSQDSPEIRRHHAGNLENDVRAKTEIMATPPPSAPSTRTLFEPSTMSIRFENHKHTSNTSKSNVSNENVSAPDNSASPDPFALLPPTPTSPPPLASTTSPPTPRKRRRAASVEVIIKEPETRAPMSVNLPIRSFPKKSLDEEHVEKCDNITPGPSTKTDDAPSPTKKQKITGFEATVKSPNKRSNDAADLLDESESSPESPTKKRKPSTPEPKVELESPVSNGGFVQWVKSFW